MEANYLMLKFVAWNVSRKSLDKVELPAVLKLNADIIAFQEIRPRTPSVKLDDDINESLSKYLPIWSNIGHGMATFNRIPNFKNINIDFDGQVTTLEFDNFYFINASALPISYIGVGDYLDWQRYFKNFVNRLHKVKSVIVGGTLHFGTNPEEISPAEERAMSKLLGIGLIDTFQELNPNRTDAYTYHNRHNDVNSRLDYFFISENLRNKIKNASIIEEDFGSAHRPIILEIED